MTSSGLTRRCRHRLGVPMDDNATLPFPTRLDAKAKRQMLPPEDGELEEAVEAGDAYATTRGMRVSPALRFLHPDGSLKFAVPYGYLPIVWGESVELVMIEYPGLFSVALAGKNLGQLETRLCDHRVTWIRECSQPQAALLPAAVTRIKRLALLSLA